MTDASGDDSDAAGGNDADVATWTPDYDVVVVGGGPVGSSDGIFTARYGLETVIFDFGRSSLRRCAHLENYLGFPAGIDVETLYGLIADHAETAGCSFVMDLVASIERPAEDANVDGTGSPADGDSGAFVVQTQDGRRVTGWRVVAATRYDGSYLRALDGDAMFERFEHDGEERERFDRSYTDHDGRTRVEGLYVASPSSEADRQVIVAAGRGARVGTAVVEDVRRERGYPDAVADHYDWVRRDPERDAEWRDRDRWRELYAERIPDDHDRDDVTIAELRGREIDRLLDSYLTDEEIEARAADGQRRLLEHLDDDLVRERAREIGAEAPTEEASN